MTGSSRFSYTLSAFVLISLISLLVGYIAGRSVKNVEGFASGCNVCGKPKPRCGCPPKPKPSCNICQQPKPLCACPSSIPDVGAITGPGSMNNVRPGGRAAAGSTSRRSMGQRLQAGNPYNSPSFESPAYKVPSAACPVPDPSKYVLKSTIPPCPPMPDMTRYMLKTECPSQPDMSKYVLKSSVPKCPPCISTCSKPCKIGECPPCPRPRCPTVNCPEPKPCAACPPVQVAPCPEPRVQCKAAYEPTSQVRPMLASTSQFGL